MNIIKKLQTIAFASMALFAFTAAPAVVVPAVASAADASIQDCLAQGTNLDASVDANGNCNGKQSTAQGGVKINSIVKTVINIFSLIVGIVAVIMIIWGGLKYITSGGDSGKVTGAKNTILYALIGLVIVAIAQLIVRFVVAKAGSTITTAPAA